MTVAGHDLANDSLVLTEPELSRGAGFRFEKDRKRWIGWRAELRRILGRHLGVPAKEVPLIATTNGKPVLAPPYDGLHFNLSHAGEVAALVLACAGPVGVDIEHSARAAELVDCVDLFCHPDECVNLPEDPRRLEPALLRIWTAKEALLKALGTGLTHPPGKIRIHGEAATSDRPLPGIDDLRLVFPASPPGHMLSVAIPRSMDQPRVEIHYAA